MYDLLSAKCQMLHKCQLVYNLFMDNSCNSRRLVVSGYTFTSSKTQNQKIGISRVLILSGNQHSNQFTCQRILEDLSSSLQRVILNKLLLSDWLFVWAIPLNDRTYSH